MSFSWAKPYEPKSSLGKWFDERLPLPRLIYGSLGGGYPVPRNLNYFWNFGVLAGLFLVIQIVTGIVLAMHYYASVDGAFGSVEHIMRDVNAGWMLRYAHANGASFFFIVVYIHIFRGLFFGSYKAPRELIWMLGLVIYLLMMATAFMGYVLPWGQMSYWGAQVITGFFSAFPIVGEPIRIWLLGGYAPDPGDDHALLLASLSAAVRDRRRDRASHLGAAHSGLVEPDRGGREEREGHVAVPPVLHRQGWLVRRAGADAVLRDAVLRAERARPPGQLHSGQPAGDPGAHRPRMVFLAVLRDPEVVHRRLHSARETVGRAGDVRIDPAAVPVAVARHVAGSLGQLSPRCSSASS